MKKLTNKQKAQLTKLVTKELKSAWGIDRNMVLHLAIDEEGKFHAGMWDSGTSVRWNEGYEALNLAYAPEDPFLAEIEEIVTEIKEELVQQHEYQCINYLDDALELKQITQDDVEAHWASYNPNTTTYGAIETPKRTVKGFVEWVKDYNERCEEVAV